MTRRNAGRWLVLLSVASILGCARVPKEAGFSDVERLVGERVAFRLHWNRGTPEDTAVSQAIERLLAQELTVDGAVQIALLNNRSLQVTYEELGIAQADVVEAGLLENPVFVGSLRFPDKPPSRTNLEFEVAQNFLNLLMMPARKRLAAAQFEQTKLRVADQVLILATAVRKAYYESLAAKHMRKVRRAMTQTAEASHEMGQRLHKAGNLSDLDLANERDQYEQTRVSLAKSEAQILEAREQLNRLMGLWGRQTAWKLPNQFPDVPEDEIPLERLESFAITNRLDLAASRQEVDVLARALGITVDWRWIVSAEVGISSEWDTDGQWVTGPALSLELPVFNQRQAKIFRLEAQLRQSQKRMAALAVDIRSEVRSLRNRLLMTRDLIGHYERVVIPLRQRIVALTQGEYNYMLVGVFELLTAKEREFDAYQTYAETVLDYWIIRADLQRAVGGRLPSPARDERE
jgi:cobalt-zinc-cadmium efflux system outer membrane protein